MDDQDQRVSGSLQTQGSSHHNNNKFYKYICQEYKLSGEPLGGPTTPEHRGGKYGDRSVLGREFWEKRGQSTDLLFLATSCSCTASAPPKYDQRRRCGAIRPSPSLRTWADLSVSLSESPFCHSGTVLTTFVLNITDGANKSTLSVSCWCLHQHFLWGECLLFSDISSQK